MKYVNQYEFITRTKEIIKQYESVQVPQKEKYEVTLLINCLVGLLIVPQQKWYKVLPTEIVSETEWGIDADNIICCKSGKKGERKTIRNVAKHLRNSISHYNFEVQKGNSGKIDNTKFKDFTDENKTTKTFEIVMSIVSLRKFTEKLTEFVLSKYA